MSRATVPSFNLLSLTERVAPRADIFQISEHVSVALDIPEKFKPQAAILKDLVSETVKRLSWNRSWVLVIFPNERPHFFRLPQTVSADDAISFVQDTMA